MVSLSWVWAVSTVRLITHTELLRYNHCAVIQSQFSPGKVKCRWTFTPMHGLDVNIQPIRFQFPSTPHCTGSLLRIYSENSSSPLNYPGYTVQCGLQNLPSNIISTHPLTVLFETTNNSEVSFYLDIRGTNPPPCPPAVTTYNCPAGPCCTEPGCCILHLGTHPIG